MSNNDTTLSNSADISSDIALVVQIGGLKKGENKLVILMLTAVNLNIIKYFMGTLTTKVMMIIILAFTNCI